jgi:hypothetical protein
MNVMLQVGVALRQALCAGWGDRIARRVRQSEEPAQFSKAKGMKGKAVRYRSCCLDPENPQEVTRGTHFLLSFSFKYN